MSAVSPASPNPSGRAKPYDYVLKFLLVGDSDVGKEEILSGLDDGSADSPYGLLRTTVVVVTLFKLLCLV